MVHTSKYVGNHELKQVCRQPVLVHTSKYVGTQTMSVHINRVTQIGILLVAIKKPNDKTNAGIKL